MTTDGYKKYCLQLEEAVKKYSNLSIIENKNGKILKGILDIPNDFNETVGSYLVEIHFAKGFPFRFPKLFETGGLIPNHIDWHKFSDNRCCITVLPDEIVKCKGGISILEFIETYCFSFFANHQYRMKEGVYLNGEYAHGPEGIAQYYSDLFKTNDKDEWLKYINHVFEKTEFPNHRNEACFCGSKRKFKNCHKIIFDTIQDIGRFQIISDLKLII